MRVWREFALGERNMHVVLVLIDMIALSVKSGAYKRSATCNKLKLVRVFIFQLQLCK